MKEYMMSMSAAALYDGGWRSKDGAWLKDEYNLTDEEVTELVNGLYEIENDLQGGTDHVRRHRHALRWQTKRQDNPEHP